MIKLSLKSNKINNNLVLKKYISIVSDINFNINNIKKNKYILKNIYKKYWFLISSLYDKNELITLYSRGMILYQNKINNFKDYIKVFKNNKEYIRLNNILFPICLNNRYGRFYEITNIFNKLLFLKISVNSVLTLYGINNTNIQNNTIILPTYFEKLCLEYKISKNFYNVYWYSHNVNKNLNKFNDLENTGANFLNEPNKNTKVSLCYFYTHSLYTNFLLFEESRTIINIKSIFYCLLHQEKEGTMIVTTNNIYLSKSSIDLIYLLHNLYENVYLIENNLLIKQMSYYIVCKNFKGLTDKQEKILRDILKEVNKIKILDKPRKIKLTDKIETEYIYNKFITNIFDWDNIDKDFLDKYTNFINKLEKKKDKEINDCISLLKFYEENEERNNIDVLKQFERQFYLRQVKAGIQWCKENNVEINPYYLTGQYLQDIDYKFYLETLFPPLSDVVLNNIQIDNMNLLTYKDISTITQDMLSKIKKDPQKLVITNINTGIGNNAIDFLINAGKVYCIEENPKFKNILENNLKTFKINDYQIVNHKKKKIKNLSLKTNCVFIMLSDSINPYIENYPLDIWLNIVYPDVQVVGLQLSKKYNINKLLDNVIYDNIDIQDISSYRYVLLSHKKK
jgi:predicted SprT family Zn-dependent metalloprotease